MSWIVSTRFMGCWRWGIWGCEGGTGRKKGGRKKGVLRGGFAVGDRNHEWHEGREWEDEI
jgi:hypothetical protein